MLTLRLHPDHKSLTDFVTCGVPVVRVRREYANSNIKDVSGGYPDAGLPILTLNFKTFKESQYYIFQYCIMPGDVPCWVHARISASECF
jgi:hypothetical protein